MTNNNDDDGCTRCGRVNLSSNVLLNYKIVCFDCVAEKEWRTAEQAVNKACEQLETQTMGA